jgi:hypothetical protein
MGERIEAPARKSIVRHCKICEEFQFDTIAGNLSTSSARRQQKRGSLRETVIAASTNDA